MQEQATVIREMKTLDLNAAVKIGKDELKVSASEIRDGIKATINYPTSKALVALKEEEVIGFATVWWEAQSCKIGYIAVKGSEQNKGAGTTLINHIEALCRKKKLKMLHTSTQPDNKKAINFYKYNKFRRT